MDLNRTHRAFSVRALITLFSISLAVSGRADIFTATFTNQFGNASWLVDQHIKNNADPNDADSPGNWSSGAFPTNGHAITNPNTGQVIPGPNPEYDVVIGLPITCSLGAGVIVRTLNLASTSTLSLAPGGQFSWTSTFVNNNGTVLINPGAANMATGMRFNANGSNSVSQLTGSGVIQLNGINFSDAFIINGNPNTGGGGSLTHGANHRIHGRGDLITNDNAATFFNRGRIEADVSASALRVFFSGNTSENTGLMRAMNGALLYIQGGVLSQQSPSIPGVITAEDNSVVQLGDITVANNRLRLIGGTVNTNGTGLIDVSSLDVDGVTNAGAMQIKAGSRMRMLPNGFVNNGEVLINTTAGTDDAFFQFDGNAGTLSGTGSIQLNGVGSSDAYLYNGNGNSFSGGTLTHGANHLIHGRGDIFFNDGAAITKNDGRIEADVNGGELRYFLSNKDENQNNGTLRAKNGATFFLETGRIVQGAKGGTIADNNSTVLLGNPNIANNIITITGGTIGTNGNGVVKGQIVNLNGEITNTGNFEAINTFVNATKLTNNGTIAVKASNTALRFALNSTLITGSGAIVLSNGGTMECQVAQDVVNDVTHTVKGAGSINGSGGDSGQNPGTFINNGTVAPGNGIGQLTVNCSFTQGNTGSLEFEIGGTTAGTGFDQLILNGKATFAGKLHVSLLNGFFPSPGDSFKIIQGSRPISGAFLNVGSGERLNTIDGTGSFIVTYNGNDVVLSSFGPLVGGGGLNLRLATPKVGGDNGSITMTLAGTGVQQGATIRLRRAGLPDIVGVAVSVSVDGTTITARFNLNGQPLGVWDVVVTNPDNTSFVIAGSFTVETGREARVWADLLNRSTIRSNSASRFTIVCGNHGNTDAYGVPLFISGIPSDANVGLEFGLIPVPRTPGMPDELDPNAVSPVINTPQGKVLALIVPVIPAGSTASFEFTISAPTNGKFTLFVTATAPLLDQVDTQSAIIGLKIGTHRRLYGPNGEATPFVLSDAAVNCLHSIFQAAVGCIASFVPGGSCPKAVLSGLNFVDNLAQIIGNAPTNASGKSLSLTQLAVGGISTILSAGQCISSFTPVGPILDILGCALSGVGVLWDCATVFFSKEVTVVAAIDPNEKVGAAGSGPEHFVNGTDPFRYAIYFENQPSATAPAQQVAITDQLDVTKLNLDTFQLGPISFGNNTVLTPPSGLVQWIGDADLRPAKNLVVRVMTSLDKNTGIASWRFFSLDPATMMPTNDPLAGFLPPNQTAPQGDGMVTYTIDPKPGLTTGTQVFNQAQIVFDANPPINTAQWLNTIDNSPPSSQVTALPSTSNSSAINLSWSGNDTGAGIHHYAIYVSENGGAFTLWKNITGTSGVYQGRPNSTYAFYSVAVDGAGNAEAPPGPADTSTTILSGRLLNIATRLRVQTGENVLIGGLIITGTDPKKVILRAIGPSLSQFFQGALSDPVLNLYQGSTLVASNDNWKVNDQTGQSQEADIRATTIPPSDDHESAIVRTLAPGAYTAVLSGKDGATGIAVVEAYDLDQAANSKLANISSRGLVAAGNDVMIGGVIAGGANNADVRVLIRGIGPSLANAGIQGALLDPTLDLADANGTLVRQNDDWQDTQADEIQATTIPPSVVTESAIVATLTPGNYTAILRGKNNAGGVALVEVYNVP